MSLVAACHSRELPPNPEEQEVPAVCVTVVEKARTIQRAWVACLGSLGFHLASESALSRSFVETVLPLARSACFLEGSLLSHSRPVADVPPGCKPIASWPHDWALREDDPAPHTRKRPGGKCSNRRRPNGSRCCVSPSDNLSSRSHKRRKERLFARLFEEQNCHCCLTQKVIPTQVALKSITVSQLSVGT